MKLPIGKNIIGHGSFIRSINIGFDQVVFFNPEKNSRYFKLKLDYDDQGGHDSSREFVTGQELYIADIGAMDDFPVGWHRKNWFGAKDVGTPSPLISLVRMKKAVDSEATLMALLKYPAEINNYAYGDFCPISVDLYSIKNPVEYYDEYMDFCESQRDKNFDIVEELTNPEFMIRLCYNRKFINEYNTVELNSDLLDVCVFKDRANHNFSGVKFSGHSIIPSYLYNYLYAPAHPKPSESDPLIKEIKNDLIKAVECEMQESNKEAPDIASFFASEYISRSNDFGLLLKYMSDKRFSKRARASLLLGVNTDGFSSHVNDLMPYYSELMDDLMVLDSNKISGLLVNKYKRPDILINFLRFGEGDGTRVFMILLDSGNSDPEFLKLVEEWMSKYENIRGEALVMMRDKKVYINILGKYNSK